MAPSILHPPDRSDWAMAIIITTAEKNDASMQGENILSQFFLIGFGLFIYLQWAQLSLLLYESNKIYCFIKGSAMVFAMLKTGIGYH